VQDRGMTGFTIQPQGAFSLRESVEFGFGQRHSEAYAGSMRLAFCLDGYTEQVGVIVRQDPEGVHGTIHGTADPATVERQVSRILSLDHDGTVYEQIGERDAVIARLQRKRPGLRPPLFHSPYEAAVWAIIATRRPAAVASGLRDRLAQEHGRIFDLDGVELAALPTPEQLLTVDSLPGLPGDRLARLHAIAEAAQAGDLAVDLLRSLGPEQAAESLRGLPGIGPFYSSLIAIRATGFVDVLPEQEPRLLGLVQSIYGLDAPPTPTELAQIAEAWRPMRTWAAVLIRAAGAG
jgi:DNA-3-methyladenine glycosylase II